MIQRVLGTLVAMGALLLSLLVFPSAIPWMVAFWLLVHTGVTLRGRSAWIPLVVFPLVLLAKNVYWMPGLILVAVVSLIVGTWRAWRTQDHRVKMDPAAWVALALVWTAWGGMFSDWQSSVTTSNALKLSKEAPVACLGDSLTSFGYPKRLEAMLSVAVEDFGADGITSEDGVRRLPEILAKKPQALIIELGGHNFLKKRPRATTKTNLAKIITDCRVAGCEPVLTEIPRGFIYDAYRGLERELAREFDLELIEDTTIRKFVLFGPNAPPGMWMGRNTHLSNDGLHPNDRGNAALATAVTNTLVRLYGTDVRSSKGEVSE